MQRLYTPQLSAENIRRLYLLKQQSGRSMVSLLNEIVGKYFADALVAMTKDHRDPAREAEPPRQRCRRPYGLEG